ncbi:DNA mismatch repair protein MutS [Tanacetum coccineum]|uniref:DNA mismatch repair protein MutS n=1 Tax=Tanacetum coccineum TaxID=301880 RepID=A0ABQ4ZNC0_9ASTR
MYSAPHVAVNKVFDNVVVPSTLTLEYRVSDLSSKHLNVNDEGIDNLSSHMASGLYVLSSERVKMPWFDSIFADIGDEQSLSQSLSTFSGHLKETSDILSQSTSQSLVLLDEVGAGTNPLEGAALRMSLLECFAEARALLAMATTHHDELETLKYRDDYCRLLSYVLLPLYLQVIEDMEKLKQKLHEHIHEARHHLKLARELHRNLVVSERRIREHTTSQRYRKSKKYQMADDSPLQPKMSSFSSQSTPKESDTALVSESNVKNQQLDPNRPFPGDGLGLLKWRMQSKGDGLGLLKWRMQSKGDGLGLLKWRMQSKDASVVPLTSNFLYVSVSMLDDSLILLEVAKMG